MIDNNDNNKPVLWVLVGANGAGKSTFYNDNLAKLGLPFVNADEIAKEEHPDNPELYSYHAARKANDMRQEFLHDQESFAFETVFSHKSKVSFLKEAKDEGYDVSLVFIHLQDVELNKLRVSQRVIEGGHNVPKDKIESRQPRTISNVQQAVDIVDNLYVLDNSSFRDPHKLVAKFEDGELTHTAKDAPKWVEDMFPEHFNTLEDQKPQEPFKIRNEVKHTRFANFYGEVSGIKNPVSSNDDFSP